MWPADTAVGFVTDVYSPEDLAHVPGSDWLVTSGMSGPHTQGHLYAVNQSTKTAMEIFPATGKVRLDEQTYGSVEPPDLTNFSAVGVGLREGASGIHTLYVVNHGSRSSVEVFEIDVTGAQPVATWVGMILHETGVWGNAVAPLPDGGIVATNFMNIDDPKAMDKVIAGEVTGNVKEWHPGGGWVDLPGTECCSANGVDISPDGSWVFVNSWATGRVIRVSRGRSPVQRQEIEVPLLPDNVKWSPRGRVLVTGQTSDAATVFAGVEAGPTYDIGLKVLSIDPDSLEVETLLSFDEPGGFGTAATALEVDDTIWISTAHGDRIAYFRPSD
jgi:hypothetical protein